MKTLSIGKGRSITDTNSLFDIKTIINKPTRSPKFPNAVYYDGVHYFPEDLIASTHREGKPYEIQGCYYSYKWFQDSFYITEELKQIICSIN